MYRLIIFFLLIPTASLICMDKPLKKMVYLQLDDGSQYQIEKWKITKESSMLCECYYSQKKQDPILIPDISAEEITLFDQALDKNILSSHPASFSSYYDGLTPAEQRTLTTACGQYGSDGTKRLCALRLTAQLADKILGRDIANKGIVAACIPEYSYLMMYLKSSMIIENIHNNLITQSPILSGPEDNWLLIRQKNGIKLHAPAIENLNFNSFNGKPIQLHFEND